MGLEPVGKFVMVETVRPPEKSAGGIVMPETLNNQNLYGLVARDFSCDIDGRSYDFSKGEKVFYNQHASSHKMNVDGKNVIFISPEEIFAVERKGVPETVAQNAE